MSDEPREALRRLEERLSQASDAADRLLADAARGTRRDRPPPAGWQIPNGAHEGQTGASSELERLLAALNLVREMIPPEVLERLAAALRELLLALRGLIDFYLERLEHPPGRTGEIRDIPID